MAKNNTEKGVFVRDYNKILVNEIDQTLNYANITVTHSNKTFKCKENFFNLGSIALYTISLLLHL